MSSARPNPLLFPKNHDLTFIQEFVQTKLYNPNLIQQLKIKQLKKLELQKAKLRQQSLLAQLEKNHKNLLKTKKIHVELKQSAFTKDQETFNIQEKIIQMEQKNKKLLLEAKDLEIHAKSEKEVKIKELQLLSQKQSKNLEDEQCLFRALLEIKKQKLSKIVEKKLKLIETLKNYSNEAKVKISQKEALQVSVQQKLVKIGMLEQKRTVLNESINQKVQMKTETLNKLKALQNRNQKSEEECSLKLVKFVQDLNQIVDDPKAELQEKKNMINVLLNVYCPNEENQIKARSISIQLQSQKQKHDSIETRISLKNASQSSTKSIQFYNEGKEPQIPLGLIESLQSKGAKLGLKQKFNDSRFQQPIIRKRVSFDQNQIKTKGFSLNRRDSLPTSLNQKDLQEQFWAYYQKQLTELQKCNLELDQREKRMEGEIEGLQKKCKQKDKEIKSIREKGGKR